MLLTRSQRTCALGGTHRQPAIAVKRVARTSFEPAQQRTVGSVGFLGLHKQCLIAFKQKSPQKAQFVPSATGSSNYPSAPRGDDAKELAKKLEVDLTSLVRLNFWVQLFLAGVSWATIFLSTHASMAKGIKIPPATAILLLGVLLSAYSAYLAFGYLKKVKVSGETSLSGWSMMKQFFSHMTLNFVGAGATIVAMQASVGSMVMKSLTSSTTQAFSHAATVAGAKEGGLVGLQILLQASANTLTAHIVSVVFLTILIQKITESYKQIVDLTEKLRGSPF